MTLEPCEIFGFNTGTFLSGSLHKFEELGGWLKNPGLAVWLCCYRLGTHTRHPCTCVRAYAHV